MESGKKILVTGGAGFIGTHLCTVLRDSGNKVISLDNYLTGSKDNHIDGVEYIDGHSKEISKLIEEVPDVIYHLGEYPRVEQSFDDIELVLESNVVGTKAVLEFWRKCGCKLIYAGSSTKFADAGIGKDQSPYAWTKASNTELVGNYGRWFSLPYAITYFYNVYGEGERGDSATGTVIGIFAEKIKQDKPLPIIGTGEHRRNFTYVEDIVKGLILVGEKGMGDEYGLGHPDSYSIMEVARMFGGNIEMLPDRPGNRVGSQVDRNRATLELGWSPTKNLPDYIKEITS